MVFRGVLTGFAEIEQGWRRGLGQAQWKQGGFYTLYSWPLWALLYIPLRVCCLIAVTTIQLI